MQENLKLNNKILNPKKVLEFKKDGCLPVQLHLQGVSTIQMQYIESLRFTECKTAEDVARNTLMYFKRLVKCVVRQIDNVKINGEDFQIEFTPDGIEMTEDSFDVLNEVMELFEVDIAAVAVAFVAETKQTKKQSISVKEDPDKKKE